MASEKRNFSNFKAFECSIKPYKHYKSVQMFPIITNIDTMGHQRTWTTYITLSKDAGVTTIPIKQSYMNNGASDAFDDMAGITAYVHVESGIIGMKITEHKPSSFTGLSNALRSNQRNALQQAMIFARGKYLKHLNKTQAKIAKTHKNYEYSPMLATKEDIGLKHIKFPCYLQPKLDGVRCISYFGNNKQVQLYSRSKKSYNHLTALRGALIPYFKYLTKYKSQVYLDGEIYKHGKRLQVISGLVRNTAGDFSDLEYHIYDCFMPSKPLLSYTVRHKMLAHMFAKVNNDVVKLTRTHNPKKFSTAKKLYKKYLKKKYEGVILRNMTSCYEHKRSKNLVKIKPRFTDEFEIIGFKTGKRGRAAHAIIWLAKTSKGNEFSVNPKGLTIEEREELFIKCKKTPNNYIGKMLTVEYESLSKDGVPLQAKAIAIRDYE